MRCRFYNTPSTLTCFRVYLILFNNNVTVLLHLLSVLSCVRETLSENTVFPFIWGGRQYRPRVLCVLGGTRDAVASIPLCYPNPFSWVLGIGTKSPSLVFTTFVARPRVT